MIIESIETILIFLDNRHYNRKEEILDIKVRTILNKFRYN
jgi:hypothetical protein